MLASLNLIFFHMKLDVMAKIFNLVYLLQLTIKLLQIVDEDSFIIKFNHHYVFTLQKVNTMPLSGLTDIDLCVLGGMMAGGSLPSNLSSQVMRLSRLF